ncbi:MAG: ATP-binding protein [Rickettsiales bacterium]|nr:ATP-binding protein [Rickettsiales bacterium]
MTISRVNAHVTYPANFQLIAAMNPCRCGYLGDIERTCNKAPSCGAQYQSKISGPMLDRFDITIDVPAVNILTLEMEPETEGSDEIRQRVIAARQVQKERYQNTPIQTNSEADGELLLSSCNLSQNSKRFLQESAQKMNLSMRGYLRVLRVARTIADLSESKSVTDTHLKQALSYRLAS